MCMKKPVREKDFIPSYHSKVFIALLMGWFTIFWSSLMIHFHHVAWIHSEVPLCVCVFRDISKMFVLSVKENVYSPRWPQEYLNNSTDSLKASVFISSKVTGLIDSVGKSSRQLEVPPGRARRDAGNVNFLLYIDHVCIFMCQRREKEAKA